MPTNFLKKASPKKVVWEISEACSGVVWANKLSFAISARGLSDCLLLRCLFHVFFYFYLLDFSALLAHAIFHPTWHILSLLYISSHRMGEFLEFDFRVNKFAVVAWFDSSTMRTWIVPANMGISLHFGPICEYQTQLLPDAFSTKRIVSYSIPLRITIYNT